MRKEIKVNIKLTVYADDKDKEDRDEVIYEELQAMMEEGELNYTFKAVETNEDEEEELELDELDME